MKGTWYATFFWAVFQQQRLPRGWEGGHVGLRKTRLLLFVKLNIVDARLTLSVFLQNLIFYFDFLEIYKNLLSSSAQEDWIPAI